MLNIPNSWNNVNQTIVRQHFMVIEIVTIKIKKGEENRKFGRGRV